MLDQGAAVEAGQFFKTMLVHGNRLTLWAATGSSMATFWYYLAKVPPNGFSMLMHRRKVGIRCRCTSLFYLKALPTLS